MARLRNMQFFCVEAVNVAIADLLTDLNARPMRRIGRSRRDLFEEIERPALRGSVMNSVYGVWPMRGSALVTHGNVLRIDIELIAGCKPVPDISAAFLEVADGETGQPGGRFPGRE